MVTREFLARFQALHEKAKSGALTPAERAAYTTARMQFSHMVVLAQQLGHAGPTLRSSLRMAKLLKVELRPDIGEPLNLSTMDLASGGFAVLSSSAMKVGQGAGFTLHVPKPTGGGTAPMSGRCTVASSHSQTRMFRVSFRFEPLHPDAAEQLEIALIDAVLERFSQI